MLTSDPGAPATRRVSWDKPRNFNLLRFGECYIASLCSTTGFAAQIDSWLIADHPRKKRYVVSNPSTHLKDSNWMLPRGPRRPQTLARETSRAPHINIQNSNDRYSKPSDHSYRRGKDFVSLIRTVAQ